MNKNNNGSIKIILLVIILVVGGIFLYREYQQHKNVLSSTTNEPALVSLVPGSLTLPPNGSAQLVVSVGNGQVGFVHTEIGFDPSKVHLANDIILTSTLARVVKITPASEANSTGKITVALGLEPEASIPTGAFTLGTLTFTPNTSSTVNTNITLSNSKVVNMTPELYTTSTNNLAIALNPVAPTPPPPPPPTPSSDTTPPSVTITSPLNGSVVSIKTTVNITAQATDNTGGSGMNKVEFYVNNSLKCTKTAEPYICTWKLAGKRGASYNITAKAYDKAGNVSPSSITVTTSQ